MRILHTSDWHLGKKLQGKSRISEQKEILKEIIDIAKNEKVDLALIAGDIFDTSVPSAEAEQLFYESVTALSKVCLPVIIAGNHDDEERLLAPDLIALTAGIVLAGSKQIKTTVSYDNGLSVQTGDGFFRVKKGEEMLNIGFLSYPSAGKLLDRAGEESFTDFVKAERDKACASFTENGINIFLSHLFVTGSENELSDERELGGSKLLPKSLLVDERCHYTALGHIHKPLCVSKSHNIYYSGSIASYSFDERGDKSVIIFDGKEVKTVPLTKGKKLIKIVASSEEEISREMEKCENAYALVVYKSNQPLSHSFVSELRKKECYCGIEVVKTETQKKENERKGKSDRELFEMFYEIKRGKKPSQEETELFLSMVKEG